jgi:hypothetical protein
MLALTWLIASASSVAFSGLSTLLSSLSAITPVLIFARAIHEADAHASFGLTCRITIAADRSRAGDSADREPRRNTADHMIRFVRRQLFCALAAQYSFVIVHILFPFVSAGLKLAHRIAVFSANWIPGTDRQSVDVAGDMVNF